MHPSTAPASAGAADAAALARNLARSVRFWDRIAAKYARDPIADLPGYERTLACARALLAPEHRVLEIGCGTGMTALRLAGACGALHGTDVSAHMVAQARKRLQALEQPLPQLRFAVATAEQALAEPQAFDRVLAFNVLHLVPDLDRTLAAVARSLRPGGLLISKTPCVAEMNPLIRAAIPLLGALGKAPPLLCFDEPQLRAAVQRAGLQVETLERHGTRGKDIRSYLVAKKPGAAT